MTAFEYEYESEFDELDYFESTEDLEGDIHELPSDEGLRSAALNLLATLGLRSEDILQLDDKETSSCTLLLEAWDYDLVYTLYAIPDDKLTTEMTNAVYGLHGEFFNFGDCIGNNYGVMPDALLVLCASGHLDSPERILKAVVENFNYPEPDLLPSLEGLKAAKDLFAPYRVGKIENDDEKWDLENPKLLNADVSGFVMYRRMDNW